MFFKDDFYGFNLVSTTKISDWFDPNNSLGLGFNRITSAFYYWLILYVGHLSPIFVYSSIICIYLVGIWFLYKILKHFLPSGIIPVLATFFYSIHASHIYQLVWVATFQETLMFTSVMISFYSWVKKRYFFTLFFFVIALFSKETVIIFPLFYLLLIFWNYLKEKVMPTKKDIYTLSILFILGILLLMMKKTAVSQVSSLVEYQIHFSPSLWMNNLIWYILWGLGVPAYYSDVFPSLFGLPLPKFWEYFENKNILFYTSALLCFWSTIAFGLLINLFRDKKILKTILFGFFIVILGICISLAPVLPIIHKWPVRLTIPLIFISTYLACLIYKFNKYLIIVLVAIYIAIQFSGIQMNMNISTFDHERNMMRYSEPLVQRLLPQIMAREGLCVYDNLDNINSKFFGSEKLKITWSDQQYLRFITKNQNIKTTYSNSGIKGCLDSIPSLDATPLFEKLH